jgi:transcriptional regulator with XRE-family HTH domain
MSEGQPPTDRELDPNAALGAVVRGLREGAGLNREELAARAGLDPDEVAAIEAGQLEPTWGDLRRLAYALGVPLPEMLKLIESSEEAGD